MSLSNNKNSNHLVFNTHVLPWLICLIGGIFYCYEFFLRVAPNIMSVDIMQFYKIGAGEFGLFAAYYSYAYTPMQIVVGLLMDHYGPRKLLSVAILCCIAGCYMISTFSSLYLGKFGLFFMGFGSAFAFVGVLKLAVNWLPPEKLGLVAGVTNALGLLGGIFAETILDKILSVITWQHAWWYAGLLGIVIFKITLLLVRDHPKEKLVHVQNVPEASWKSLFFDLTDILKNYQFILNGLIGCILLLPISVFATTWANLFFQQAGSISPQDVSNYLVPSLFLGMVFGGPIAGMVSEAIGRRRVIFQVCIIVSALIFTAVIWFPGLPLNTMVSLLFVLGFFTGGQVLVFVVGVELSAKEASGTAAACTNFLVTLGPILFLPLIGFLLEYQWDGVLMNDVPFYNQSSYQYAMLVLPLCYVLALVFSFFMSDTHPKARARELAYEEKLISLQ